MLLLAALASGGLVAVDAVEEKCFCSGVASQCREATSYYWATLRQAFIRTIPSPASNFEPLGCRPKRGSMALS